MASVTPALYQLKTGDSVTIRCATAADAASVLALTRAVISEQHFLVTQPDEFDLSEDDQRSRIAKHADSPDELVLVADQSGPVLGVLSCEAGSRQRLAHRATFQMLVERGWRGRGIGTALLQTLIAWAEEHPTIEKLGLAVSATNSPAIGLYRRFGFVEEGRRPRELRLGPNQYVDDVLMYRFV
jgi:ribosomal protein S18 acetylase RimI-like enzyme